MRMCRHMIGWAVQIYPCHKKCVLNVMHIHILVDKYLGDTCDPLMHMYLRYMRAS